MSDVICDGFIEYIKLKEKRFCIKCNKKTKFIHSCYYDLIKCLNCGNVYKTE